MTILAPGPIPSGSSLGTRPKITWFPGGLATPLVLRYPLDEAAAYPRMSKGSDVQQIRSGETDAWTEDTEWCLSAMVRYIPATDEVNGLGATVATGWDGASGWRAFLEYCWNGGTFLFFPDGTTPTYFVAELLEPAMGDYAGSPPSAEPDYSRALKIVLRRSDTVPISGYTPAYRARFYKPKSQNDSTESQLLVPAAGAPHSDVFAVSTLPEFTDTGITYKPYLDTVAGERGQIDLLAKATDKGSWTLEFLDKRTGGSNLERWLTAFLAGADGVIQLGGCRCEIDRSLDGGSTWNSFATGRVRNPALSGVQRYTTQVRDLQDDMEADLFVGQPHTSITYASLAPYCPLGLLTPFGGFPVVKPIDGIVRAGVQGFTKVIECNGRRNPQSTLVQSLLNQIVQVRLDAGAVGGVSTDNFAVRFDFEGDAVTLNVNGKQYALRSVWSALPDKHETSNVYRCCAVYGVVLGVDGSESPWDADLPAAGGAIGGITITPAGGPTDDQPMFISDVHPVQLWKDIMDGKFGYLDATTGAPLTAIKYDAAAFAALIADTTIPNGNWVIKKLVASNGSGDDASVSTWLVDNICSQFALGFRLGEDGSVIPLDLRLSASAAATIELTDTDLVSDPSAVVWGQADNDAITRMTATWYVDQQLNVAQATHADTAVSPPTVSAGGAVSGGGPSVPGGLIDEQQVPEVLINNTGRARDLGDHSQTLDALAYHGFVHLDGSVSNVSEVVANLAELLDETLAPFQAGAQYLTLWCLPTTRALSVTEGTWFTATITKQPNSASNTRGGSRLVLCLKRTEDHDTGTVYLRCIDAGGAGTALNTPTLASPTAGVDTRFDGDIAVTLDAANDPAAVYWNAQPAGTAVRPADSDPGWRYAGRLTTSRTLSVTNLPSGSRIFWRARSVSGVDGAGGLPSAWVYPPPTEYLDTTALTAPTGLNASSITSTSVLLLWFNTEADCVIEVLNVAGAGPPTGADIVDSAFAGSIIDWLRGLGPGSYTAGVRYRDPYGGVSPIDTVSYTLAGSPEQAPDMAGLGILGGAATAGAPSGSGGSGIGSTVGIQLTLFGTDLNYQLEIHRAFDDGSGNPDLATEFALTDAANPIDSGSAVLYVDATPNDGARRHYRARQIAPNATPGAWTCWRDALPMQLPVGLTALAAQLPTYGEGKTQTATVGTLALTVDDPQCRVTQVRMKSKSGNNAESAYAVVALSGGVYTDTVALIEGLPSTITYEVTGYDASGALGVIATHVVTFGASNVPALPIVSAYVTAGGSLVVTLSGDVLTDHFKVAASTASAPTDATVRAASPTTSATRVITLSGVLTGLTPGQTVFIGAFAYAADGTESAQQGTLTLIVGSPNAAPNSAEYLVLATDPTLTSERVFNPDTTNDLAVTDHGAGANYDLALKATGVAAATYGDATHVPQIAVDAKGRITAASNVAVSGGGGGTLTIDLIGSFGDGVNAPQVGEIRQFRVDVACTIVLADIFADTSGSAVVDVQTSSDGVTFTSIAASAKPTLSSQQEHADGTLTGWTLSIPAGDYVRFVLNSVSTCKQVSVALKVTSPTGPVDLFWQFGDGVSALMSGYFGDIRVDTGCVITVADIYADASGSAVVDVQTSTNGISYSSICGAAKPTLSSQQEHADATLTGWTTTLPAGTYVRFLLNSVTTCKMVGVTLKATRT